LRVVDDNSDSEASKKAMLLVATLTFFVFPFMASSVNIALPRIGVDLALDAVSLGWVATAYLLSSAVLLVPFGRIADIYGRKRIFIGGMFVFTVTSFLSGVAGSGMMLISFRVLQGIGVAMLAGTGVALLTGAFPASERGRVLGLNATAAYVGLALGPVLGGVLTQHLGWRSIFLLTTLMGAVVIAVVVWKLKGEWSGAKGQKFDFVGSLLYSLALVALVYGFTVLPAMTGVWLVVGGVSALGLFARWQVRNQSPVLDIRLFRRSRAFTFSSMATLLEYTPMLAVSFLISLHLQYVKGLSPESAGLILTVMPAVAAVISPLAGRLSDRIEPRTIASAGMALTTTGVTVFIFLTENTSLGFIVGNMVLLGFGHALFASPNINAVMSSVPKTAYGVGSAMVATMRQIGMVLGMGIAMLMLALYVGRIEIMPEHYPLFQEGMRTSFIVLAVLCFGGMFISLARGKVR
jgi:EmrB/QacA subfamily drug resistance transporter